MKKLCTVLLLAIFCFSGLNAQERRGKGPDIFEKIKAEKISFFTGKLDLSPAEAQEFWPVYNEFEKKRFEVKGLIHGFESMPEEEFAKLSASEIEKLTNDYVTSFEKEALLFRDYNKQFQKILPKKKVLMLYRTENQFRSYLIKQYQRDQRRN